MSATWTATQFVSLLVAAFAGFWGISIACWRWMLRSISRPERDSVVAGSLRPRAQVVRRNLRLLMAFNFVVLYPIALPAAALLWPSAGDPSLQTAVLALPIVLLVSGVLILSVAMLSLARSLERAEAPAEQEDVSLWVDGPAETVRFMKARGSTVPLGLLMLAGAGGPVLAVAFARNSASWALIAVSLIVLGFIAHEFR